MIITIKRISWLVLGVYLILLPCASAAEVFPLNVTGWYMGGSTYEGHYPWHSIDGSESSYAQSDSADANIRYNFTGNYTFTSIRIYNSDVGALTHAIRDCDTDYRWSNESWRSVDNPGEWTTFYPPETLLSNNVCIGQAGGWYLLTEVEFFGTFADVNPPVAGFSCTPLAGAPPQTVTCLDGSENAPTSWQWSITNENTTEVAAMGSTQNITVTLYDAARYNVSLSVGNPAGNATEIKEHYINIGVNTSEYSNGTYSIMVAPAAVGVGGTVSVTADSLSDWDDVFAYMITGLPSTGDATYGALCNGYPPYWYKKSETWYQYDGTDYTISWGAGFPAVTQFTANQPGIYTVQGRFWDDQGTGGSGGAIATDEITITGTGQYANITFRVIGGGSGAELAGSQISIQQSGTGAWTNSTTSNGRLTFPALKGIWYSYKASASGYQTSDLTSAFWDADTTVPIRLTPITTVGEGNWTLWASVNNENGNSISGATVRLSDGQAKTTGSSGVVSFTVLEGGYYTVTAMRTGYQSQEQAGTVEEGSDYFYFTLRSSDNVDEDDDGIPNEDDDDDDGDGVPDTSDPDSDEYASGNYTAGALNERASGGLMEMMDTLIALWPLGLIIVILAALKRV